jgi:hypothetical protein
MLLEMTVYQLRFFLALQTHVNNFSTRPGARSTARVSGGSPYKARAASSVGAAPDRG